MKAVLKALGTVITGEPSLVSEAIRMWLLFFIGRGVLEMTVDELLLFMAAVGASLSLVQRALVTPTAKVEAQVAEARKAGADEKAADIASLAAPKPVKKAASRSKG